MRQTKVSEIAKWLQVDYQQEATVCGVAVDNRMVQEGDLFVCLRGAKVDGHTFAQSAIDLGAVCLMVDRYLDIDCPQILVKDTLNGLIDMACAYRDTLNAQFVVISGSNGKTSTKDMFLSCLSLVGGTIATLENQNTEIGTCLNLFRMDDTTRFGVFEAGLDEPDDLPKITRIMKPDYAVLTSLDQAHMDNFGTMEALGKEKFTLFMGLDQSQCYYNGDNEIYRSLGEHRHSFGLKHHNEFVVSDVVLTQEKVSFKVNQKPFSVNLLGKHQAVNAASVIAVLGAMGVDEAVIRSGLQQVKLTRMRTEVMHHHKALILFDAYKSSPQSAIAAVDVATAYPTDLDRYCVMADMYQLGEGALLRHQEVLNHILAANFKGIYLYGPEFGAIMHHVHDKRVKWYDSFTDLYHDVQVLFNKPSFIMFKGSRFFELERLLVEEINND